MAEPVVELRLAERTVAEYVLAPDLDPTLSPRPYLHPVRTLAGVVVTDALPADHRWHLGASLAVPDVAGSNLWGGRTFVRGTGYTWRGDHGRIAHAGFDSRAADRLVQLLRWCDPAGRTLLRERRSLRVRPVPGHPQAWALDLAYALTAPAAREIPLGSPATNGRPGGSGYGGFFWRAAAGSGPPRVFTATAAGEAAVNGATEPWLALVSPAPAAYSLIFIGLADGDHWFVRSSMYPGVCAAFAYQRPRVIGAGATRTGRHTVLVVDGAVTPAGAARLVAAGQPGR
jgi:hypothetical protein